MSYGSPSAACERSARALEALPQLWAAVVSSEISWSVARRAVAHASPETAEALGGVPPGLVARAAGAGEPA